MQGGGMSTENDPLLGRTLGRVRIDAVIGEGNAAGRVYRGHHAEFGIPVAVKTLHEGGTSKNTNHLARFRQEAQIAARLDHPGIVRVLDFGQERGISFLVMELLMVTACGTIWPNQKTMSEKNMLRVMVSVANALDAAHAAGIVHRDPETGESITHP